MNTKYESETLSLTIKPKLNTMNWLIDCDETKMMTETRNSSMETIDCDLHLQRGRIDQTRERERGSGGYFELQMNRVVTRHSALRRMIQRVSADFDRFVSGRVVSYPKLQIVKYLLPGSGSLWDVLWIFFFFFLFFFC